KSRSFFSDSTFVKSREPLGEIKPNSFPVHPVSLHPPSENSLELEFRGVNLIAGCEPAHLFAVNGLWMCVCV
uniref:Uncharacterized protein n=2 Tax=Astyanax mexicanus TaxID=7994 RepID=A0A3B1K9H4_ASTMX